MNYSKRFVVEPGAKVKLHKIDPGYIDPDVTEQDALAETKKLCKRLRKLRAGAGRRPAVLLPPRQRGGARLRARQPRPAGHPALEPRQRATGVMF